MGRLRRDPERSDLQVVSTPRGAARKLAAAASDGRHGELFLGEVHGDAVDAIAEAGGRWAVFEDMAQMAAALAAMCLDTDHAEAAIDRGCNRAGERVVKAWPAGAAVELGAGDEEFLAAAGAGKAAPAVFVIEGAGAGAFGAVAAQDVILFRSQQSPPLGIGMGHREFRVGNRAHHSAPSSRSRSGI